MRLPRRCCAWCVTLRYAPRWAPTPASGSRNVSTFATTSYATLRFSPQRMHPTSTGRVDERCSLRGFVFTDASKLAPTHGACHSASSCGHQCADRLTSECDHHPFDVVRSTDCSVPARGASTNAKSDWIPVGSSGIVSHG